MKFKEMELKYKVGLCILGIMAVITSIYAIAQAYDAYITTGTVYINGVNVEILNTVGLISWVMYTLIVIWRHRNDFPTLTGGKR